MILPKNYSFWPGTSYASLSRPTGDQLVIYCSIPVVLFNTPRDLQVSQHVASFASTFTIEDYIWISFEIVGPIVVGVLLGRKQCCKRHYCLWRISIKPRLPFSICNVITKTRLFKYTENFTTENWKFQIKLLMFFFFHISAQNIDCGYSLEPPRRGGSNEYPQSMFWAEIWKILFTPVNPSFTI